MPIFFLGWSGEMCVHVPWLCHYQCNKIIIIFIVIKIRISIAGIPSSDEIKQCMPHKNYQNKCNSANCCNNNNNRRVCVCKSNVWTWCQIKYGRISANRCCNKIWDSILAHEHHRLLMGKKTRSSADADNQRDAFSGQSRSTIVPFWVRCDFSLSMWPAPGVVNNAMDTPNTAPSS